MISLIQILKEIQSTPKAIIMAGGASVGKSTVLKSLESQLSDFNNLNADKYVLYLYGAWFLWVCYVFSSVWIFSWLISLYFKGNKFFFDNFQKIPQRNF